jgi:outer membrane protein assembly factor BamB
VVVGRKEFVPTFDGRIYEIETAKGNVLGHFELHQRLTVGGVLQQGTDLLYFPGDSDYLYVLNAQTKQCVAILHTGHPSSSLRSEPIVINRIDPFPKSGEANKIPSFLILTQSDGLDHVRLRVFELPIENPDPTPLLKKEPRIHGYSWFRPYYDDERVAFVTDTGLFSLFGIQQVRNFDEPIFPELPEMGTDSKQPPVVAEAGLVRGQVVHVVENDFWILANGNLQRIHFDPFGPRTAPVWSKPLPLGSAVHAAQVDDGTKTLFVVSQDPSRQIYLATAVAAEEGTILWQRQLGLVCQGDPLVRGQEVTTLDRGGGLCVFDGTKYQHREDREWRATDPLYAPPLTGSPVAAYLLSAPDGSSVYEVAYSASSGKLTVRHCSTSRVEEKAAVQSEETVPLTSPLAGTPALVGQSLLLPLADGTIRRFPLPLAEGRWQGGPNWRAAGADDDARCHIVALNADEFITTNGSRGLTHWQWRQNEQTFQMIPMDKTGPTVELPARIVSAPVVLSSANAGADYQVCVADSQGNITLLQGPELKPERSWPLHGQITAGLFRRGQYLGCVVDRRRLVWLDPAKAGVLWEHTTQAEGIVGQPQLVGELVVVADLSGRFVGLDPANGKVRGSSYTLKVAAAPAATPVPYGPDTAFVPLTDGTVVLLPMRQLRDPLAALPSLGPW